MDRRVVKKESKCKYKNYMMRIVMKMDITGICDENVNFFVATA